MTIAWQHNPQGSIHNEAGVSWGYWIGIGAGWSLPAFACSFVVVFVFARILRRAVQTDAV